MNITRIMCAECKLPLALCKCEEKAIKATVKHWDEMIEFAKFQPEKYYPSSSSMDIGINQNWYSKDCPLCKKYNIIHPSFISDYIICNNCPIEENGFGCCHSNSLWHRVAMSCFWKEWLKNAIIFRNKISELLEKKK